MIVHLTTDIKAGRYEVEFGGVVTRLRDKQRMILGGQGGNR